MKMKHFTFDLDYFPVVNSNVFHNIKIEKSKTINSSNKQSTVKRFPFNLKRDFNLQDVPDIMFFEKSYNKPKLKLQPQNLSPVYSNQTKRSHNKSCDQLEWSFVRRNDQNLQTERKVESCPKQILTMQNPPRHMSMRNSIKPSSLSDRDKQISKSNIFYDINHFQRNSNKKSQLQSLEECQSEFDSNSQHSLTPSKNQKDKKVNQPSLMIEQIKKPKFINLDKHNKYKKKEKSLSTKNNNPQILSSKQKIKKKKTDIIQEKDHFKAGNSLINNQIIQSKNKFISLARKSYYLVGSKNNKNRSLNKQKKMKKNTSLREDSNVILSNADGSQHSSTGPSNCRNSSLTNSTANSKVKAQSLKYTNQSAQKNKKKQDQSKSELFEIVKKTGQILGQYRNECILLKKQKDQYQQKYEQAIKKLNRIREEIEFVMKTE